MRALVVGGTGPTGPFIVEGLLKRGYEVAILHRGVHEIDEIPPQVEHIHTDPNFRENLDAALAGRTFDLAVASYGRLRFVAESLVGRTGRIIALGGSAYRGILAPQFTFPTGETVPIPETRPSVLSREENKLAFLISQAEDTLFELHPQATYFRLPPFPYGPHQVLPREWLIIRRLLDARPFILLPDGGLSLYFHGYAANIAEAVLLAVDNPAVSKGQRYNCGDEDQLTLRQIVEVIAEHMGRPIEVKSVPLALSRLSQPLILQNHTGHTVLDLFKLKRDLGYRDVLPAVDALQRTTDWLLANRIEAGGHMDRMLNDPFDYDAEDRFAAIYERQLAEMAEFAHAPSVRVHPYAHPKSRETADEHGR